MNMIKTMAVIFLIGLFIFTGCASNKPSNTSATTPEQETPGAQSSVASSDASASTDTPSSGEEGAEPFQPIPLKDLPTKMGYPYAIKTKWPDLVRSPYAQDKFLNISKFAPGSIARCTYTGKKFVVP